jgi:hypothetical protein
MKRIKTSPEDIHHEIKEYAEEIASIVGESGDPVVRCKLQHIIMNCSFLDEQQDRKRHAVRMLEKYWGDVLEGSSNGLAMLDKDYLLDESEFQQFLVDGNFSVQDKNRFTATWVIRLLREGGLRRVAETLRCRGFGFLSDRKNTNQKIIQYLFEYHGIALDIDFPL